MLSIILLSQYVYRKSCHDYYIYNIITVRYFTYCMYVAMVVYIHMIIIYYVGLLKIHRCHVQIFVLHTFHEPHNLNIIHTI